MKAIETRYKGYRFRSRLEARWAVFFDTLGVPWEYEKQGFHLRDGNYLPDFWFPTLNAWAEVKPDAATFEWPICEQLAGATGHPVIALIGPPDLVWYEVAAPGFEYTEGDLVRVMEASHEWVDLEMTKHKGRLWYAFSGNPPDIAELDRSDRFRAAVSAARGARFEHGEHGQGPAPVAERPVTVRQWKQFTGRPPE